MCSVHLRAALALVAVADLTCPARAIAAPQKPMLLASAEAGRSGVGSHHGPSGDDLGQRRAIRGATVDVHESDELRMMREFEADRFGPARRRELGEDVAREGQPYGPVVESAGPYASVELPDVPVRWDARVLRYLDFYKNEKRGRSIMSAWLKRQGRYRELIEAALDRHHLPRALLYVAMIESGYDPRDRSSAGAAGLWQFMPEGARIYGLRIDYWIDERNDPEKATEAAMRYFDDLHARFGSWHLALGAFNAGYGAVLNSIAKYNTNDYWALSAVENGLPWETMNYVPKWLATAVVGDNRALFGYDEVAADPPRTFDRVRVPPSTTLANVALAAGVTAEAVVALNPELRRDRTPPEPWYVRVPRGSGPRLVEKLASSKDRVKPYDVKQGDRLESIAKAARVSVPELRRINNVRDPAEVRPGVTLVVPDRSPPPKPATTDADSDGAQLVAVPDVGFVVEGKKRLFYRVAPGDGIAEIARFFGVVASDLARWNHVDLDARLFGSQILAVWVDPDFDAETAALDPAHLKLVTVGSDEFFDAAETKRGRVRLKIAARAGDTLKKIGARYGLGEADMERINHVPRSTELKEGQALVVYVPADKAPRAVRPGADDGAQPLPAPPPLPAEEPGDTIVAARVRLPSEGCSTGSKVDLDDAPAALAPVPPPADDPCFPDTTN